MKITSATAAGIGVEVSRGGVTSSAFVVSAACSVQG